MVRFPTHRLDNVQGTYMGGMDMFARRDKRFFLLWVLALFILLVVMAPMGGATARTPMALPAQQGQGKDSVANPPGSTNGSDPNSTSQSSGGNAANGPVTVKRPLKSDVSPPSRDIKPIPPQKNLTAP